LVVDNSESSLLWAGLVYEDQSRFKIAFVKVRNAEDESSIDGHINTGSQIKQTKNKYNKLKQIFYFAIIQTKQTLLILYIMSHTIE
jgi:hypothetical protein